MNKKLIITILVILLVWFAGVVISQTDGKKNYDLSDFPEPFIKDKDLYSKIVLGERAIIDAESSNILFEKLKSITGIAITYSKDCPEGLVCTLNVPPTSYIVLDNEPNILSNNVISIGGPCANKITAQIMNLPNTWPECASGFEESVGRIILYNKWNKTQIVVAGYSADDTRKSAEVLANYQSYNLSGFQREIIGKRGNLSVRFREFDSRGNKIEDKIYSSLRNPNQPSWVDNGDGTWNLLIKCYEDIDISLCKDRLMSYGHVKEQIGISSFIVAVKKDNIRLVAEDDYVLVISRAPAPTIPHD